MQMETLIRNTITDLKLIRNSTEESDLAGKRMSTLLTRCLFSTIIFKWNKLSVSKNLNDLSKMIPELARIPLPEFDIGSYLATSIV